MNYPHINVEETFDQLVRDYGTACVLRDVLPKQIAFKNADYLFHSERIVAELKCLMEDNSQDIGKQLKLNALINQYFLEGNIKTKIIDENTYKSFPKELQLKISDIYSPSIRARIKKANIQIRETKQNLRLGSYSGMLIIANDGLTSMPPAAFVDAAVRYDIAFIIPQFWGNFISLSICNFHVAENVSTKRHRNEAFLLQVRYAHAQKDA